MGVVVPNFASSTEDRVSGAQIVDGGLKIIGGNDAHLTRTLGASGATSCTFSLWVKKGNQGVGNSPAGYESLVDAYVSSATYTRLFFNGYALAMGHRVDNNENYLVTSALFRDTGWYHIVGTSDSNGHPSVYVNGVQYTDYSASSITFTQTSNAATTSGTTVEIATQNGRTNRNFDGLISNFYFIDGQALGPGYFGYTDPLTNTWRPRKRAKQGAPTVNNGTVWSSFTTPGSSFRSGFPAVDAFNGIVKTSTNDCAGVSGTAGDFIEFDFSSLGGIPFSTLEMQCDPNNEGPVYVNGIEVTSQFTAGSLTPKTLTGITSPLTTIKLVKTATNTSSVYLGSVIIDGVMMTDSTTTTVDFGTNGFYLPLDGSAPIGEDQSGQGNDWTPVNFSGSAALDKATGALPILNTDGGGKTARPGVFGSEVSKYYTLTGSSNSSTGYVFENEGTKPTLSMIRGATHTFDYTSATSHPLYLSSLSDGKHNAKAYSVSGGGSSDYLSLGSSEDFNFGSGDWTIEVFFNSTSTSSTRMWYFGNNAQNIQWSGTSQLLYYNGSTAFTFGSLSLNTWYHLALVNESGTVTAYIDGVKQTTFAAGSTATRTLTIGNFASGTNPWIGYISNFRIIKGTALYTSDFTPPTTTLTNVTNTVLLCCQDSDATTAVVSPGAITANGSMAATNTYNPFVYNVDNYFGVDTSTSNVTKMTVPHYAPDTLYYYCNVHSGMGNSISVTTDTKKADPYAWKNVLGLPLVGNANDVSNQINSGSTTKTITANGSAAASSSYSNFYGGSFNFGTATASAVYPSSTSSDFAFGTGDFTVEFWFYSTGTTRTYFGDFRSNGAGGSSGVEGPFIIWADNGSDSTGTWIRYAKTSGSPNFDLLGGKGLPPINTWHHLAIVRSSGTVSGYLNGVLTNSTTDSTNYSTNTSFAFGNAYNNTVNFDGYLQDLRIYKGLAKYTSNFIPASTDPDILPDTPSGVSYSSKLTKITDGAVSFDGTNAYLQVSPGTDLTFGTNPFTIEMFVYKGPSTSTILLYDHRNATGAQGLHPTLYYDGGFLFYYVNGSNILSTANYKTNTWQHYALVRSTTTNTIKLYIDGVEVSSASDTNNYVAPQSGAPYIGQNPGGSFYFDGFVSNLHVVNGTALYTSNFTPPSAPLTDVTNTKLLCCKSNSSATAFDVSPGTITSVNAVATNFNPFTTDINTVRGQETGYATLNPLDHNTGSSTFSNGNLKIQTTTSSGGVYVSTMATPTTGKWYAEVTMVALSQNTYSRVGLVQVGQPRNTSQLGNDPGQVAYRVEAGDIRINLTTLATGGSAASAGDIIGMALDLDNQTLKIYKNGTLQATASNIPQYEWLFAGSDDYISYSATHEWNFGQKPFKFPPPEGFQPLNAANVRPSTVIARPDQYVGVTTYTGNGGTQNIITGFKPDFVWIKGRSSSTQEHRIFDSVRGAYNYLETNSTEQENNGGTPTTGLTNFTSNGFTLLDNTDGNSNVNGAVGGLYSGNAQYVAWCWKAGGNSNTFNIDDVGYDTASAAGLTAGTITPTGASVNTKSGFSIIGYTGTDNASDTFSHGLTKKPDFAIFKNRSRSGDDWIVYHSSQGATKRGKLNLTNAFDSQTSQFNDTEPTSSVFTIGTFDNINKLNNNYIAYIWAEIPGFSKFGSYVGTNTTDNVFVNLGFKPAFLMIKNVTSGGSNLYHWCIYDNERSTYNPSGNLLWASSSVEENNTGLSPKDSPAGDGNIDFLSNGFKVRSSGSAMGGPDTFIYAAWAEAPSFNLYGAQSNAR